IGVDPGAGHLARVPPDHVGVLLQDDDLVAVLDQVGGDVLAHLAGTGDGDLHTLATFIPWRPSYLEGLAPAGQMLGKPAQLRPHDDEVQEVPLLQDEVRFRNLRLTEAGDGRDEDPARYVELGHPCSRGGIGYLDADGND